MKHLPLSFITIATKGWTSKEKAISIYWSDEERVHICRYSIALLTFTQVKNQINWPLALWPPHFPQPVLPKLGGDLRGIFVCRFRRCLAAFGLVSSALPQFQDWQHFIPNTRARSGNIHCFRCLLYLPAKLRHLRIF